MAEEEAAILDALLELLVVVAYVHVLVAELLGLGVDVGLYVAEQLLYVLYDAGWPSPRCRGASPR